MRLRHANLPLLRHLLAIGILVLVGGLTSTAAIGRDDARALEAQASKAYQRGDYSTAAQLLERLQTLSEARFGSNSRQVASILGVLSNVYIRLGRIPDAELVLKRGVQIVERASGPNDPVTAKFANDLAGLYLDHEGRCEEAEALFKRVLAIREQVLRPDSPEIASALNNLANAYGCEGKTAEAQALHKRVLAIRERVLGPVNFYTARSLNNIALGYVNEGRYADAQPLLERALAIFESTTGSSNPAVADALDNLSNVYIRQGRAADAGPFATRALAIWRNVNGEASARVAGSLCALSDVYESRGQYPEALTTSREAVAIMAKNLAKAAAENSRRLAYEAASWRPYFLQLVYLLARSPDAKDRETEIVDEAFRAAQYAGGIDTARALAGMTARFAAGSDALAALVREREDLAGQWRKLDSEIAIAMAQPAENRNRSVETALRAQQADIEARTEAADARLRRDFPRFAELTAARPAAVADVQTVLRADEVFVAWSFDDERKTGCVVPSTESYLFVVRKNDAHLFRLAITRAQAADAVQALRASLVDASIPFDVGKAHDLYKSLLGPADGLISDAKHLIVVPDGALQSLPPSVLVTAAPTAQGISNPSDYKGVAWLIRRQAISILPAASSLVSLRRLAEASHAQIPFAGFGDPDFKGAGLTRGIKAVSLYRGADAVIDGIRNLPRLPETAGELRAEAKALDAPESSVHLGSAASVSVVKRLDLSSTRVVAFATHGLIAGDLPRLAEPALVLSPPADPTPEDDGLLRASQVSQLKLDADFVILSACNTAASDGKPGAEGLSGLAKAFFYAGARSLLVSHWPVDSDATVKLTTGLIRATVDEPSIGRAAALRRAILAMIDGASNQSQEAHPSLWAPFVLAGEGGAGR